MCFWGYRCTPNGKPLKKLLEFITIQFGTRVNFHFLWGSRPIQPMLVQQGNHISGRVRRGSEGNMKVCPSIYDMIHLKALTILIRPLDSINIDSMVEIKERF
jgi:hypothetical protein